MFSFTVGCEIHAWGKRIFIQLRAVVSASVFIVVTRLIQDVKVYLAITLKGGTEGGDSYHAAQMHGSFIPPHLLSFVHVSPHDVIVMIVDEMQHHGSYTVSRVNQRMPYYPKYVPFWFWL